jgi:hypothetical protein
MRIEETVSIKTEVSSYEEVRNARVNSEQEKC